jgi:hypothetical protein
VPALDIKGFFDNLDHALLMRALRTHTDRRWIILSIARWLTAPAQLPEVPPALGSLPSVDLSSGETFPG